MKIKLILCLAVLFLSSCRAPVEEMSTNVSDYSIDGVSQFFIELDCSEADMTELKEPYIKNYCSLLKNKIETTIQEQQPDWALVADKKESDLFIQAQLEQLYGGNQPLRLFFPFEAGRTMLTVHFSVYKNKVLIAERRLTEITRMIHFEDEKYTNEEAISEDTNTMATYLADYINNPTAFDQKLNKYRNGYHPH